VIVNTRIWWPAFILLLGCWLVVTVLIFDSGSEAGRVFKPDWITNGLYLSAPYLLFAAALGLARTDNLRRSFGRAGLYAIIIPGQFAVGVFIAGRSQMKDAYYITDHAYVFGCAILHFGMGLVGLFLVLTSFVRPNAVVDPDNHGSPPNP
jgi:hypothetical protein